VAPSLRRLAAATVLEELDTELDARWKMMKPLAAALASLVKL
jgi:hypothetical protein